MATSFRGYLNDDYLENQYLGDEGYESTGMQVERVIAAEHEIGMQVERQIANFVDEQAMQVQRVITTEEVLAMQVHRITSINDENGMQIDRQVVDYESENGMQTDLVVTAAQEHGMQTNRIISDFMQNNGMQINRIVFSNGDFAMEIRRDKTFPHTLCADMGYLSQSYLETPYLTAGYCVAGPMQIERHINDEPHEIGMQIDRFVNAQKRLAMQVERIIADFTKSVGMQVALLRSFFFGMQIRVVLYNTTRLRVLAEFPSRGTSGTNWTATSTETGDFDVNNLNTDIVEQVWRSENGTTSAIVSCDTEVVQGVPVDTFAALNHNLTTSASVVLEASNDSGFSPVEFSVNLSPTETNMYYIAPTFPTQQFRYWRLVINDPTNPSGFLQIGTIVFGTTVILQGEAFVDEVTKLTKHFSDKVATEGFTNVSNDRAIKNSVSIDFRNMQYNRGNFKNLRELFEFARTSLKCLWIPDPQQMERFTVFGKLTQIPAEKHVNRGSGTSADNVDFTLEVDESL